MERTRTAERTWSSVEACRLVGLSYRQLHYWTEITPCLDPENKDGGSGSRRRYSDDDVRRLDLMNRLRTVGLTLERTRDIVGATAVDEPVSITVDAGVFVLAEWRTIAEIESAATPIG